MLRETALGAAQSLFNRAELPAAVLAANNVLAESCLFVLRELRLSHSVSVVVFDDAPWMQLIDPPLTVVVWIPDQEFKERTQKIRGALDEAGLEVGMAYATEHMPGDVQYLTGYDPHLENVALLVTPDRIIALGGAEGAKMFEDSARFGEWRGTAPSG